MVCDACSQLFKDEDGIPLLFWPNNWENSGDVTELVKSFYEENPFPNYEEADSVSRLQQGAMRGIFARLLDEQIPDSANILEAGCGTGQLSNFLSIRDGRTVFGTDLCLNSLRLGETFRQRNGLENVMFLQMNLFKPVFRPESFDVVICNGVLHHTSDPYEGFRSILNLAKPGGLVIVGLYNRFGRIQTDFRRPLFKATGDCFKFLDHQLKTQRIGDTKKQAWFMDQYRHPHESKHTMGEVLKWFNNDGVDFVNSIPKAAAFKSFSRDERLFAANHRGSKFDHLIVQAKMLVSGGQQGGLFFMIGRKTS